MHHRRNDGTLHKCFDCVSFDGRDNWQVNKQRYIIIIFNIFLNYIKLTTEPEEDKIISFLDEEVVQWLVTWQDMKGHYAKISRKFIAHRSAKYCNVRHVSPLLPDHALFTYKGIPQPIRRWQRTFFLWRRRFCNFAHSGTFGDKTVSVWNVIWPQNNQWERAFLGKNPNILQILVIQLFRVVHQEIYLRSLCYSQNIHESFTINWFLIKLLLWSTSFIN